MLLREENKLVDREATLLFDLNKRALDFRNSKQYFIGDRLISYGILLKHGHIIKFIKRFSEDAFRVLFKKKSNPSVEDLDFQKEYQGEKIAVYTAIYGPYDVIMEPLYKDPNCEYYIFTDQEIPSNSIWKKVNASFPSEVNSPLLKNRYIKMMPHRVLPQYRYSVYIDGNLIITSAISQYFVDFKCKIGIGMHLHPSNTSIYEEVKYNLKLHKITKEESDTIRNMYIRDNMPKKFGMTECNVIMRDSNNQICKNVMDEWWKYLLNGIKRDQLYFTYVLYILGYKIDDLFIIGENINANPMFIRKEHQRSQSSISNN